ncbi:ig-like domain-containing protein [Nephila pilipes]|uniref:Ig-like domain-containing protein n=1 Tax=Nephila pilipes TaxID=299642 RepID=A0A8X6TPE2_NEPPI|nr:ig-like domain-containing protein [Nephila pilipes]
MNFLIFIRSIDGNPIICNCSAKWIQKLANSEKKILGPLWDQVTCVDPENSNTRTPLMNLTIPNCELPKVYVMPEKLIMNESQSADLICSASGDPPITLYWNTSSMVSNHTIGDWSWISSDYENGSSDILSNFNFDTNNSMQVLSIYASHGADNGFVSCIAENDVGQEISEVSLEING